MDEIDGDGNVATITDVIFEDSIKQAEDKKPSEDVDVDKTVLLEKELDGFLTKSQVDTIVNLYRADGEPVTLDAISEKTARTKIHSCIREIFGGKLVTDTTSDDRIRVARKSMGEGDRKRVKLDKRNFQDPNKLPCVKFTLRKEFMETIEAIQIVAKKLGVNPKDVSVAGTKDKRGITTQFVTVRYLNPMKLTSVNGMSNGKIKVSNVKECKECLKLGDLSGNRFSLVLREIMGDDIDSAIKSLKEQGFINYYGLQRFGSMSVKSHDIGIKLLQSKYQEAIDLILAPRDDEFDGMAKEARRIWSETKDAKAAHDAFPYRYNAERQILWHFHKQENQTDLVGSLLSINRDLRLMYVHSVQSLVWNRIVSERLKRYGRAPIVGDLVMGKNLPPTPISEDTISNYTIYDVVIPLPGYDIKPPLGQVGSLYQEIVEKEFELMHEDCFKPKSKALWDLPGAYRHIVTRPRDVEWRSGYYNDPDVTINELDDQGSYRAVVLSFSLPTSAYATMAVREVMQSQ